MAIPAYGTIGDILIVPLTDRYNMNYLPFDANGKAPIPDQWFDGGDIQTVPIRPHLQTVGTNVDRQSTNNEINLSAFFPVGDSLG